MSEPKKPTDEELWERAGYLRAAASVAPTSDYLEADRAAARALRASRAASEAALFAGSVFEHDKVCDAAYVRGMERWKAEHPEARA
jgi:hypothetical protein